MPRYYTPRATVLPEDRFWAKVAAPDENGCWPWTASCQIAGYGQFYLETRHRKKHLVRAHRWAYEDLRGAIPGGLTIDHLCRNRQCVNPHHMEIVSMGVNVLRGNGPPAINARKEHCPQGHPYAGDNLRVKPNGWRYCRKCQLTDQRKRRDAL